MSDIYSEYNPEEERKKTTEGQKNAQENAPAPMKLDKNRKIAVAVLFCMGFFVMYLWAAQFKKSISQPFVYQGEESSDEESFAQADSEESLRLKDTDGDGLSDYDELYIYNTSAYLEDSDSDGFPDREEVSSNNDPNCPINKDCQSAEAEIAAEVATTTDDSLAKMLGEINSLLGEEATVQEESQVDAIRQAIIDSGMSKEALDKFSDEDLMKIYNESLEKLKEAQ